MNILKSVAIIALSAYLPLHSSAQKTENLKKEWETIGPQFKTLQLFQAYTLSHEKEVSDIAWNHDGKQIATASNDYTACIWDFQSKKKKYTLRHNGSVLSVAWNHNGTQIATASADKTACIWNPESGKRLHTLRHNDDVASVAWNHNGTQIATASFGKTACIWNYTTAWFWPWKELHKLRDHNHFVHLIAWNHNGTHIATGSSSQACIWNSQSGEKLHILGHYGLVTSITWNHNGTQIATASNDCTANIWDPQSGKKLHTLRHTDCVVSVAWNHNSTRIATASDDNTACIWNPQSGEKLHTLAHNWIVNSVAWNHNSTQIATASNDYTVCIWNPESGEKLYTLLHNNRVKLIAWNHDGTRIATALDDKTAYVWDTTPWDDPLYKKQHAQLIDGTLEPHQSKIVILFNRFNQQKKLSSQSKEMNEQSSLKEVTLYDAQENPTTTTTKLVRTLLTFHPVIMQAILAQYNLPLKRPKSNSNDQPPESYIDAYNAFQETKRIIFTQEKPEPVYQILEEYIVDEYPMNMEKKQTS